MKIIFLLLLTIYVNNFFGQNNVHIFSSNGEPFTVFILDSIKNNKPQTHVLIEHINEDTLLINIEFADKIKHKATLLLFEKGKPTTNKEFNYKVTKLETKITVIYSGIYDIVKPPNPLVPKKPLADTSQKYKNILLGHFCELKDGKPLYFNNIPKQGACIIGMPNEYLNYINVLMLKAQVDSEKYAIVENVLFNNCTSTSQLITILKDINYELEKLKLIKLAYPHLIDKSNKKQLENVFRFESSISELNAFFSAFSLNKTQSASNCNTASPDTEITTLLNQLNVYTNDAQCYEALKKLHVNYCYTKEQVLSVLKVFIHDREKLDAAKLLYYRCIEKETFLTISEIFSYNETISDLNDFVFKQNN